MPSNTRNIVEVLRRWIGAAPAFALVFAVFSAVFLPASLLRTADNDVFARLAVGSLVSSSAFIPGVDPFSFGPKGFWYDHEWLSGVIFYLADRALGDAGLFLMAAGSALATIYFLLRASQNFWGRSTIGVILLAAAAFPSSFIWTNVVRSQIFTFLGFSFLLFALSECRTKNNLRPLMVFPILTLAWANCHAGFVLGLGAFGLGVLGLFVSNHPRKNLAAGILALSLLAPLFNPYGADYLGFIASAVLKKRPEIDEWARLNLLSPEHIGTCFLIFASAFSLWRKRRAMPPEAVIFLPLSLYFGIKHARLIPFFNFSAAILCVPLVSEVCQKFKSDLRDLLFTAFSIVFILSSAFSAAVIANIAIRPGSFKLDYSEYPVAAVSWLKSRTEGGNLLLHFNDASYAIWAGYPKLKVAVDGRYEELYTDENIVDAMDALSPDSPNQAELLKKLNPDYALICERTMAGSWRKPFPTPWLVIYEDQACRLWSQRG